MIAYAVASVHLAVLVQKCLFTTVIKSCLFNSMKSSFSAVLFVEVSIFHVAACDVMQFVSVGYCLQDR